MHDDEVPTDAALVRRLLAAQFPQWAELTIEPVLSDGTDNAMYRLGDEMAVRLPRRPGAVPPIAKEHDWLAVLAPRLPLPLPLPLVKGEPGEGYPWPWSVCRWLEGEPPEGAGISSDDRFASDLARFVLALQAIDATAGPGPGAHNLWRGARLRRLDATIRERLAWLADLDEAADMARAWRDDGLEAAWEGPAVWLHGDLFAGNLLVREGRLAGVIDWSCLGVGDPACDLQAAWHLFDGAARTSFRRVLGVDDATWRRGRAWGLAMGVLNFSYYRTRSPGLAEKGRTAIARVLASRRSDD